MAHRSFLKSIFTVWFILTGMASQGQAIIKGIVVESGSNQPLPFVNVFLSTTSMGSTTATDGSFQFKVSVHGKYELVASFIGYAAVKVPVVISHDSTYTFGIQMVPKTFELPALMVRADTNNRKRDFAEFKRLFLGETPRASACRIKNPKSIYVYRDKEENVLSAYAREPIEIENQALGYLVYFDLENFKYDYGAGRLDVKGTPRFEDLKPGEKDNARNESYAGSLTHLMHSILTNQLREEGWRVAIEYRSPRPSNDVLDKKISYFKRFHNDDSVAHYKRIRLLPPGSPNQSPILHGHELVSREDPHAVIFKGRLLVSFKNESDERTSLVTREMEQRSEITFLGSPIILYDNGYFEPQSYLDLSGYLAWTERISEFLPLGFVPKGDKKK